jgi:Lrp/AsnC family transcriptional regulator, regulator of ectoine-degradation genes
MTTIAKKSKIDRIDLRILAAVAERGRQTITELSKRVGLSPSPCTARLERLESENLILGYHADIDVEKLADLSLYYVTLALKPYTTERAREVEALILDNPFIVSGEALFGSLDYLLRVYARSTQHYHEIMSPFTAHAIDYETWPVSRRVLRTRLHGLVAEIRRDGS